MRYGDDTVLMADENANWKIAEKMQQWQDKWKDKTTHRRANVGLNSEKWNAKINDVAKIKYIGGGVLTESGKCDLITQTHFGISKSAF